MIFFKARSRETVKTTITPEKPKQWFDLHLWTVVLMLLVGYPAFSIRNMMRYFNDFWSVIEIVLVVWGVLVALQLLNRHTSALRNAKLYFSVYLFSAITEYVWIHIMGDGWQNVTVFFLALVRVGFVWLLIQFSQRSRMLFPNDPLLKRNPYYFVRRYFSGNLIGQVFAYGTVALLVVAVLPASTNSSENGNSDEDTAQELAAVEWLESNPDTLKQQMKEPTGVRPTLTASPSVMTSLDAKTNFEQNAPAVVVIYTTSSSGAGFFLTADGVVATSQHILDGEDDAVVMTKSGELYPISSILACEKEQDFCLFKVDVKDVPYIALSDSSEVAVGDPVVVIGHPHGYNYSLSAGVISGIHEYDGIGTEFQYSASTSSGNSGGPVLNDRGEVVGIVESSENFDHAQNLNFAIATSSLNYTINR